MNARSTTIRLLGPAAAISALLLTAGCGGGGSASAKASPSAAGSSGGGSRQAFEDCLKKNGVTLPSRSPGSGQGRGGFFGGQSMSPQMQKAFQACRSVMPNGGRFGGINPNELAAFRTCMKSHGVTIPTGAPSPRPSGSPRPGGGFGGGALRGLNTADPKVAAALKICRPLLPTRSASPRPSS